MHGKAGDSRHTFEVVLPCLATAGCNCAAHCGGSCKAPPRTTATRFAALNATGNYLQYDKPTYNGYRVDICKSWTGGAANCGKPAADYFCQLMGYAASTSFGEEALNQTYWILNNAPCSPGCAGLSNVVCYSPFGERTAVLRVHSS